jgi:2-polyprenyl-3-methyl-5-hydroxy-6-metoxy-1,4-benzoquinol methylase
MQRPPQTLRTADIHVPSRAVPTCNICEETSSEVEESRVRSNCRKFGDQMFRIWRCPKCHSVHAGDEVDLAEAYRDYPYHLVGQSSNEWLLKGGYKNLLNRLRKVGLKREHKLLDYGCGGGGFLRFARSKGYNVEGFDEYSEHFNDPRVIEAQYDFVLSQDVIEHVVEPWEHLRTLSRLAVPGGIVAIGTPNAELVDMQNPTLLIHALHQPYHRHIFSKRALVSLGERLNWQFVRSYAKMYAETLMPGMNGRFFDYYTQLGDNTLDFALEPLHWKLPKLYTPIALFWAFFGYFFVPEDSLMVVYRTAEAHALPRMA